MTVAGVASALVVGIAVGLLGRWVGSARRAVPGWLTVAAGVVAALAGSIVARLAGVGAIVVDGPTLAVQTGAAVAGVALVVATAVPTRLDLPEERGR